MSSAYAAPERGDETLDCISGPALSLLGLACEGTDRRECKKQFRELVSYRAQAIDTAFGDLFGAVPAEIQIKFVTAKDPSTCCSAARRLRPQAPHDDLSAPRARRENSEPSALGRLLLAVLSERAVPPAIPVVEVIDNVLWNAFLQEAASARGGQWPHKECSAVDVGRRLPCEMLVKGIAENVKALRGPLFNVNRVDQIWPDDFAVFRKRVWRTDQEYQDVQRYGGIMLVKR
jgi:hypothetical protein